jgi:RNA polymerase sigma-70 factor (ECF subfamily)
MDSPSPRQASSVDQATGAASPAPGGGGRTVPADFRALFEREISYVWTSLRRLGVPERDREDLAHEVFFRVYKRLADYDPTRPVRPWLFAFAVRVTAEYRRRAQHRHEELGGAEDIAAHAVAPKVRSNDDAELVTTALETLDMDKRAVLVLHDLDEHSVPEIAVALGIPEGTAYSRLRAGREHFTQALRRLMRREG